jgi:hypothetical protein
MSRTPVGPTIAVSALLVGTLLVWGGITNRNPVAVLRAVLGGKDLPAAGSWGGAGNWTITSTPVTGPTVSTPVDPTKPGAVMAPGGEPLQGPLLGSMNMASLTGDGRGYYHSAKGERFFTPDFGKTFYVVVAT